MSEKAVEVVQALLQELSEIIGEKPALAKRLLDSIEYLMVNAAVDPLVLYRDGGEDVLRKKLKDLGADDLRMVVKQHHIPCQQLSKRRKAELIDVIVAYAANTDIGEISEAA